MTAAQSLKIYQILHRYFKSDTDAQVVVEEIVQIVEDTVNQKKDILLTKDDKIALIEKIDGTKNTLVNRMDSQFKWLLGIMITLFGVTITLIGIILTVMLRK